MLIKYYNSNSIEYMNKIKTYTYFKIELKN